ncbi:pilus assembly protein [Pararhizobium sp. BT-229]|nr:pilus assembly protein [Pararhizobium sp. BT-229]MCV9961702.1 pilus assembly protein [Pararhizobium sp. BT-229]
MLLQRNKRVLLILAVASLASGCADYLNHRDTITFGAGNAVEANKGIHIQDPFPRVAQYTRITSDGKVIYKVIRNHQGGGQGTGTPPTAVVLPVTTMGTNGASGTSGYAQ